MDAGRNLDAQLSAEIDYLDAVDGSHPVSGVCSLGLCQVREHRFSGQAIVGEIGVHLSAGSDKDEELAISYSASHVPRSCSLPEGIVLPPGLSRPNLRVRGYSATTILDTSDGIYINPLKEALPAGSRG